MFAFQLPLPPLSEQERIAAKLDSLFARSKAARDELALIPLLIEHYKQALLEKAFSPASSLRPSEFTRVGNRSYYRLRGSIPALLNYLKICRAAGAGPASDKLAGISGGLTKNSKRTLIRTTVPYLRVANVYANELRLEDIKEIGCTDIELKKTRLRPDDLLIVEGNGSIEQIGRVAMWDGSIDPCSHQNHLIRARSNGIVPARYLLYWLLSPKGRQAIERVASSSAGLHTLSITKVSGIPVPATDPAEARLIVDKIETALEWLDKLSAEYAEAQLLEHLDQGLLKKAFCGELVPAGFERRTRGEAAGAHPGGTRSGPCEAPPGAA